MSKLDHFRTGDQTLIRQMNLSVILHHLREHAPLSRAELAAITGLNKTTISSLVRELIAHGFVYEGGLSAPGAGRPAVLLRLNPDVGCMIGAEIGVDFISVVRANFATEVVWQHRESIGSNMGQRAVLDRLLALLRQASYTRPIPCARILGVAIGVPGLVDLESGTLLFAPNLGWHDVPIRSILSRAFPVPIVLDNEANLAALGEQYFGAAQGHDDVLYISAGVGVGAAVLRGGKLCRGAGGFAGEFGHMTVDPRGDLCSCGNRGCWETLVSEAALFRNVRNAIAAGERSRIPEMLDHDLQRLSLPLIVAMAEEGDPVGLHALEQLGRDLGMGIASLVNALNPELVVLGGTLSVAGHLLLPIIQAEVQRRALSWSAKCVSLALAKHGSDSCVMGGVAAILQGILTQPGSGLQKVEPARVAAAS